MINGLGILGWGVGGIEAEAAMLGQPVTMLIPDVVGMQFIGKLPAGTTAKDIILALIGEYGAGGAAGHVNEFAGPVIQELSFEARMTL